MLLVARRSWCWLNRAVAAGSAVRPACGSCGSNAVLPLVYGPPDEHLAPLFAARLIAPGGPMGRLADHSGAHWVCMDCRERWRGGLFGGGSGDAPGDPVAICGIDHHPARIRAEYMYLVERFGLPAGTDRGWRMPLSPRTSPSPMTYRCRTWSTCW